MNCAWLWEYLSTQKQQEASFLKNLNSFKRVLKIPAARNPPTLNSNSAEVTAHYFRVHHSGLHFPGSVKGHHDMRRGLQGNTPGLRVFGWSQKSPPRHECRSLVTVYETAELNWKPKTTHSFHWNQNTHYAGFPKVRADRQPLRWVLQEMEAFEKPQSSLRPLVNTAGANVALGSYLTAYTLLWTSPDHMEGLRWILSRLSSKGSPWVSRYQVRNEVSLDKSFEPKSTV